MQREPFKTPRGLKLVYTIAYCHERFFDGLVTLVEWDTPMQVTETLAFSLAQYETVDHTIGLR